MIKYVIHRQDRKDRLTFVNEMEGQGIDDYKVFNAHGGGISGLLKSMQDIIKEHYEAPYILMVQDDIKFTNINSYYHFLHTVKVIKSHEKDIALINGGVSWVQNDTTVKEPYFRMRDFSGLFFTLYFKKIYDFILSLQNVKCVDRAIGQTSGEFNMFCVYPIVSICYDSFSDLRLKKTDDSSYYNNFKWL